MVDRRETPRKAIIQELLNENDGVMLIEELRWKTLIKEKGIVRWPALVKPNGVSDSMIGFTDIMATFADLMGDDFPEAATTDSQSFLPILKGDTRYQVRETLIMNFKAEAFRHNNWKLITQKDHGGFAHWDGNPNEEPEGQFYDLAVDRSEKSNLWDTKPGMVKTLLSMLEAEKVIK